MGSVFNFKQFVVDQAGCAMRINTDGVILAAVADQHQPLQILDIGTGTGVIAMMLAQRFEYAKVDAVEIDADAAIAAEKNFRHAPFADRMNLYPLAIEDFYTEKKYDLIVSNPPFFINDLKNAELKKQIARHTHEYFFDMLLRQANSMLKDEGKIWLILPLKQAERVLTHAVLFKLYPERCIAVHSDASKPAFRQVICLSHQRIYQLPDEHLYIYAAKNVYTDQYKELLKDFFLAF